MKIEKALLCAECGEIVTSDEQVCPDCTSSQFLVLAALIDPASRALRETIRQAEVTCGNQRRRENVPQ